MGSKAPPDALRAAYPGNPDLTRTNDPTINLMKYEIARRLAKHEEDLWGRLMLDRGTSGYDERESLRCALLRVGLELDDGALSKLVPQALMLRENAARIAALDLSTIEPGLVFDARWKI